MSIELKKYSIYEIEIVQACMDEKLNYNLDEIIYVKIHPRIGVDSLINIIVNELFMKYFILNKNLKINYFKDSEKVLKECFNSCGTDYIENKFQEINKFCSDISFFKDYYKKILDNFDNNSYYIKIKFKE